MLTLKRMETWMGVMLTVGTFLSALIVLAGGILFLFQHGGEMVQAEWLAPTSMYVLHLNELWLGLASLSPTAIILFGLLVLVATQVLRVALLVVFYWITGDYIYTYICSFILLVLLISFVIAF